VERLEAGTLFGEGKNAARHREQLWELLRRVLPGLDPQRAQHVLITELLSLLDLMIQQASVPFLNADTMQVSFVRALLERAIFEVIE
jgi:hypothetical protein